MPRYQGSRGSTLRGSYRVTDETVRQDPTPDVVKHTCHKLVSTVGATIAALFRSIDQDDPAALIVDEADAIWSKKSGDGTEDLCKQCKRHPEGTSPELMTHLPSSGRC